MAYKINIFNDNLKNGISYINLSNIGLTGNKKIDNKSSMP